MAEWTPAKRKELYASLASGNLEAAIALVEPHVDLRPGDFAPQDKKALKSFAAKATGNRKVHERIAGLLAHTNGTMRRLGTITFGVLDEYPVELIMEEVRRMTFRMNTERKELQKGMMGGRPKEFMTIFEGLAKAAWKFPTDEGFLFPAEFEQPTNDAAEVAKKEAIEPGGLIYTLEALDEAGLGDEDETTDEELANIPSNQELVLKIIGDLAGAQISNLAFRWMEISGESLLRHRGYDGALEYLGQLLVRFQGQFERRIIERMYDRILEAESKRRCKPPKRKYSYREELLLLGLSITNPNILAAFPAVPMQGVLFDKLRLLADDGKALIRELESAPREYVSSRLESMLRKIKAIDKMVVKPRFDIQVIVSYSSKRESVLLGWNLYKALPWRDEMRSKLIELVEVIYTVLAGDIQLVDISKKRNILAQLKSEMH